jgi:2-keto-4-pentenoate hydratase/2-oxohepta-3-ene-1,7-dioic acid hydratase in catechol pathway
MVVVDERACALEAFAGPSAPPGAVPRTVSALIEDAAVWVDWLASPDTPPVDDDVWRPLSELELLPVLPAPPSIYGAGANYFDHVRGMSPDTPFSPEAPYHFLVSRQALCGHRADIVRPTGCTALDWEVELAVVIGRYADHIAAVDALDVVAGYTIANDISARDLARRTDAQPFSMDWLQHKSYRSFLPLGPTFVPRQFVGDPQALRLSLAVNGTLMQDSSTAEMVFGVAEQIAFLSSIVPLVPGDVICTGTPAGTGHERGHYLQPGDVVTASIEGLGTLENRVVDADQSSR